MGVLGDTGGSDPIRSTAGLVWRSAISFTFTALRSASLPYGGYSDVRASSPELVAPSVTRSHISPVMTQQQLLGTCPHCRAELTRGDVLIEYRRNGTTTHYAECPSCETVVRPD